MNDGHMPIVYFGNDWFAENRTSSHHIATRLAERLPLLYVEVPGLRAPKASARDAKKLWKKLSRATSLPSRIHPALSEKGGVHPQMWHMTLPQIPFRTLPGVGALNRRLGRWLVKRALRHLGFERPLLWFAVPHAAPLAGQLDERGLVYYCIDDYASLPDVDRREIRRLDEILARRADQVFVASRALLEAKQPLNPRTAYSPHGVDVELFGRALNPALPLAAGARALRHPVIGFFGLLEAWTDLELLSYLARSRPQWTFLLIGRAAIDVSVLRSLPNVILPGPQPHETLPQWAKAFDVAIVPLRQNEQVRHSNPLKVREYLAAGKPVVSVPIPEVERFADCVGIARTHEEFLAKTEDALKTDSTEQRAARLRAVAGMTWEARVDEALGIVQDRLAKGVRHLSKREKCLTPFAPIRVGIVGAGYVSAYHLRALTRVHGVTVVGIADPNQAAARQAAATFGIPAVCRSLEKLAEAKPDVVHILTPPALHGELAVRAMQLGCHVFVEKPMAETVEECDRMIEAAQATGRVLSVNHSARMDPVVLRALELVRRGALGEVLAAHFFRNSDYPSYAGGAMPAFYGRGGYPFADLGAHGLSLLEAFLGAVTRVEVRYRSTGRDPHLFFDEWHAVVEAERGRGAMYLSWNARPMQNELVIHGTRGRLHVDCYLQTLSLHRTLPAPKPIQRMLGTALVALGQLYRVPLNAIKFLTGRLAPNPGIGVSVRRFYEALAAGGPPPVSAEEGRRIVCLIEQAGREADAAKARAFAPPLRAGFASSPAAVPPRILVTGASGLLGGALLGRLRQRGETVRLLLRRPAPALAADPQIDVVYGDLGDPEAVDRAVRGVELVYHVGAATGGRRAAFEAGTIWGTKNVVAACLRHGVKRLVYVSSVGVLDHAGHRPGTPIDETAALEPRPALRGFYTQAKLNAERIVLDAIRQQGLPAVILRPGQIFGRGAEQFAPTGTITFGGRWFVVGDGRLPLPLVYVDDVVDALLLAAQRDGVLGSTFHIVDPADGLMQHDYIDACRRLAGPQLRVSYVPRPVLMAAAILAGVVSRLTKVHLPLSLYRLRSSRPLGPFDGRAAREVLGWTPRIGARRGLDAAGNGQDRT